MSETSKLNMEKYPVVIMNFGRCRRTDCRQGQGCRRDVSRGEYREAVLSVRSSVRKRETCFNGLTVCRNRMGTANPAGRFGTHLRMGPCIAQSLVRQVGPSGKTTLFAACPHSVFKRWIKRWIKNVCRKKLSINLNGEGKQAPYVFG